MAQLDTSILRRPVQPMPSRLELTKNALGLKSMAQQGVIQQQAIDENVRQAQDAERALTKQKLIEQALGEAGGDIKKALPRIMQIDPQMGTTLSGQISQQEAQAASRAASEATATKTKQETDEAVRKANTESFGGVLKLPKEHRAAGYGLIRPGLIKSGAFTEDDLPSDDAGFQTKHGMSMDDFITQQAGGPLKPTMEDHYVDPETGKVIYRMRGADNQVYYEIGEGQGGTPTTFQAKNLQDPTGKSKDPYPSIFDSKKGKYYEVYRDEKGGLIEIKDPKPYERPQDPAIAALRDVQTQLAKLAVAGGGINPNQRAELINSSRASWGRAIQPILDRRSAVAKIDSGIAALKAGNRNAATQTIVTAFNKLQDEHSVVREGEYARSEEGQAMLARIQGAITRISEGGANLTDADLTQLAVEAKNIANALEGVQGSYLRDMRQGMEETLDDYNIPYSRVFGSSDIGARPKPPAGPKQGTTVGTNVTAAPKGPKVGEVQDGYKFKGGNPADPKNWTKQ